MQKWLDADDDDEANEAALDLAASYAAWATLSEAGHAIHKIRAYCSRCRTSSIPNISFRSRPKSSTASLRRICPRPLAASRRLRAHRSGHGPARRARPGATTASSATTRARTAARTGLQDKKTGEYKHSVFGVTARRLPARREDLRDERGQAERQRHRRAGASSPSTTRCAPAPAIASATTA